MSLYTPRLNMARYTFWRSLVVIYIPKLVFVIDHKSYPSRVFNMNILSNISISMTKYNKVYLYNKIILYSNMYIVYFIYLF